MGCSKSSSKREVHGDISLPQETITVSKKKKTKQTNRQKTTNVAKLKPKGTRKRRTNKTQS